jgi:hypothetical protein
LEAEWADPREIEGEEMGRRNPRAQGEEEEEEEEGKNPRLDDKLGKSRKKLPKGKKRKKTKDLTMVQKTLNTECKKTTRTQK